MTDNDKLNEILAASGKTIYTIAKESGVNKSTIYSWATKDRNLNFSLIKVIYTASKDDTEFLKNIKKFI